LSSDEAFVEESWRRCAIAASRRSSSGTSDLAQLPILRDALRVRRALRHPKADS